MTEDQHVSPVGCLPVFTAFDLGVGAAEADALDVNEHLALGDAWLGHVAHRAGARATRYDRERMHARSI